MKYFGNIFPKSPTNCLKMTMFNRYLCYFRSVYNRYIKVFWHDDNAILDGKCDIKPGQTLGDRNMKGKLIIELPLATRHIALVDYEYDVSIYLLRIILLITCTFRKTRYSWSKTISLGAELESSDGAWRIFRCYAAMYSVSQ